MTFADKFFGIFRRKAKKSKVRSHNGLLATPLAMGMAPMTPEIPRPSLEEHALEFPAVPPRALLKENTAFAGHRTVRSLMAYGQTDLAGINGIPGPAWAPDCRMAKSVRANPKSRPIADTRSWRNEGLRHQPCLLGLREVILNVLDALEAYEELEEGAAEGVKASLAATQGKKKGEGGAEVKDEGRQTVPKCADEEALAEKKDMAIFTKMEAALGLDGLKRRLGSARCGSPRSTSPCNPLKPRLALVSTLVAGGVDQGLNHTWSALTSMEETDKAAKSTPFFQGSGNYFGHTGRATTRCPPRET
ncbi:uncharacterized protein DFL_007777 [Arthrobotrys flagrans]|uniref:Uncharacterized protein n=1 Tax=Arthrobotrys flagrans TaxID=97331 RepID=A0A436ZWR0_ARTFL|nr:hypothetical protein DFL_007777 [Arthrobotrys flagrans]